LVDAINKVTQLANTHTHTHTPVPNV
jgi:hypothetical protein